MVKLVKGKNNRIAVKTTASIDYTGFSAILSVKGIQKGVTNLKAVGLSIDFSPEEVSAIGESATGLMTIVNRQGNVHMVVRIVFRTVEAEDEAIGFQEIKIVIVSLFKYDGCCCPGIDDAVITEKVNKAVDEVIDDKVSEVVDEIIDDKVTTAVDAVIDDKVEQAIEEFFDISDSDTLVDVINDMRDKIDKDIEPRLDRLESDVTENIKPRLEAVEQTLANKVSLDYEDSDEGIAFHDGLDNP